MDDEDHIHDLVWDREELYKESLEDEFFYCLKQIENKTENIPDDEFGPVIVKEGEVVCKDISENKYKPIGEIIRGGKIPKESAESIINIIVTYLDNGWEMPQEMREYLSSRFKKAIKKDGENLQSLFHLREFPRDESKDANNKMAADYISFRFKLNSELEKDIKSNYLSKKYLYASISDHLKREFKIDAKDKGKINRLINKSVKPSYLYDSIGLFLADHADNLNIYKKYLLEEIGKGGGGKRIEFNSLVLEWIEKSIEK
ncbi:hypothetical protein C9426_18330 [Serratia sp. S1B]|nr:hypothetical protein C9426_18330 [Serratia sp. S1B]